MKLLNLILIAINFSAFILMGYDKLLAKHARRRIPELEIFMIAFLGGAAGIFIGMKYFKHKTKHYSFTIGIPLMLVLNIIMVVLLFQTF
ncbi:MAG: DUF1294 domain-containing protein [Thermincola sp.]|jgi:uncharacterized membrane protein YsdA (DUF1294 family)|nr:DUF1294 domain-containing protein [Thermincola sp.]MDT3702254.1 DUF1294 domain-containing protein [Thermincola sp.]